MLLTAAVKIADVHVQAVQWAFQEDLICFTFSKVQFPLFITKIEQRLFRWIDPHVVHVLATPESCDSPKIAIGQGCYIRR